MDLYLTLASIAFRSHLSQLVSPLRRVRSRTPFFLLPAHRIPTLWTLYRGLLRDAPTPEIRWRIRAMFRHRRHLTSPKRTIVELERGFKWVDIFRKAKAGDEHLQAVLQRYSRLIKTKRAKFDLGLRIRNELQWQTRLRTRPILTGGFLRPTLFHGPLPRMKPQPSHVTGLIVKRKKARTRRQEEQAELVEVNRDMYNEYMLEKGLGQAVRAKAGRTGKEGKGEEGGFEPVFDDLDEWQKPIRQRLQTLQQAFQNDLLRASSPYPPALLAQITLARQAKIINKTHQRQRQLRGELVPPARALQRKRQRPPAHVWCKMSKEEREMDSIVRGGGVGEVGFLGAVKRRMGVKMRKGDVPVGLAERLEVGDEKNREIIDEAVEVVRKEMERRRRLDEEAEAEADSI